MKFLFFFSYRSNHKDLFKFTERLEPGPTAYEERFKEIFEEHKNGLSATDRLRLGEGGLYSPMFHKHTEGVDYFYLGVSTEASEGPDHPYYIVIYDGETLSVLEGSFVKAKNSSNYTAWEKFLAASGFTPERKRLGKMIEKTIKEEQ